jgi:hypothetical protein
MEKIVQSMSDSFDDIAKEFGDKTVMVFASVTREQAEQLATRGWKIIIVQNMVVDGKAVSYAPEDHEMPICVETDAFHLSISDEVAFDVLSDIASAEPAFAPRLSMTDAGAHALSRACRASSRRILLWTLPHKVTQLEEKVNQLLPGNEGYAKTLPTVEGWPRTFPLSSLWD